MFFLLFFALFCFPLLSAEESIVVRLATEAERLPLYLAHFQASPDEAAYAAKLEAVLRFDLAYNGMTEVIASGKQREKLAAADTPDQTLSQADWSSLGVYYLIKGSVQGGKLSLRLYAANSPQAKAIEFPFSGTLGQDRQQVHQLADNIHKALFNTDGIASTRLLYTVKKQQGSAWSSEVWESDYDGYNRKQLTVDSGYSITPVYVPPKAGFSSGSFFFVSYKSGQPKIYYQTLSGGQSPHRLTLLKGNQLMPAIARQRDKIAFISDVTGNPDLFIQPFSTEKGAVGKPYQIFSTHLATQGTPTFSPDGKQLAFVSNKDGAPRIYVMEIPKAGTSIKGLKAALITKRNKESSAPAWSPDGTKLAYCAVTQGVRQIWIYDFLKKEERQLTQGPGNKENPSWAPNSLHLAFNSTDAGSCELYIINLNQADAVCISAGEGEKRFPSWEPR
jgi:TolB protein